MVQNDSGGLIHDPLQNVQVFSPCYAVLGVACGYEYFTHKIADNIARKNGKKNIETKARYGKMYVDENPAQYEYVLSKNEAFAKKYVMDEATGKVVKRK